MSSKAIVGVVGPFGQGANAIEGPTEPIQKSVAYRRALSMENAIYDRAPIECDVVNVPDATADELEVLADAWEEADELSHADWIRAAVVRRFGVMNPCPTCRGVIAVVRRFGVKDDLACSGMNPCPTCRGVIERLLFEKSEDPSL